MVFLSAMKLPIPHLAKRPTARISYCIHTTLLRRYASQDQPAHRPPINHNSSGNSRHRDNNSGYRQNNFRHNNNNNTNQGRNNNNNGNYDNYSHSHGPNNQKSVARYTHQPRQKWMNVNPSRASINIYKHNLLLVQYCSAVLLLRTQGILLNPFHPLLRTALQRHQETYEIGYFFHLHTSSKLVTGKQSSVRKGIRGKVRAAWEQVLTKRGYDVKTGRFTGHLKPGFDQSKGHIILPDLRGTISINPSEACSNAPFPDVLAACEAGLDAVLKCKHRNMTLEEWMKPANLWRFYDWKRRDLLNKYMTLGHGFGQSNRASQIFKSALIGLRNGKADIRMNGKRTAEGGYLVELDGETFDLAPLNPVKNQNQNQNQDQDQNKGQTHTPEKQDFNDENSKLFQEAFEQGDATMEGFFGGDGSEDDGFGSGDLDWGLEDIEPEGNSQLDKAKSSQPQPKYLDDF
ncbi:hypothetical protein TWF730_008177 [Orbilia blumenaviensis]|uniref:Uncharacterized protein n=1 Tax=Orbilia blumenaviensis TaxID=1796055 RepID=A0AAV9V4L3_9PEZI